MRSRGLSTGSASAALFGMLPGVMAPAATTAERSATTTRPPAVIRVNTVGFAPTAIKRAYLLTDRAVSAETFTIRNAGGHVVMSHAVGSRSRGRWSASYPAVYPLQFSALHARGTYTIHVTGTVMATSSPFHITSPRAIDRPIITDGLAFFHVQRDGAQQVRGSVGRRPSHLRDRHAAVYRPPDFVHPTRSDIIRGRLRRVPDRAVVNTAGGWFDAGDYLKFTHTAAYADVDLFAAARALGAAAPAALRREARYGEAWLAKMWRQRSKTLYLQVGIGSGDRSGSFVGDHDLWRLPQADDKDTRPRDRFAAAHRPVFRAAKPHHRISPNLVGRVAAAFALAAQSDAHHQRSRSRQELRAAESVYRMAATAHPPHPLVTTEPVEYYPEDSWHDDMALGGAEIALARQALGRRAGRYLRNAAHWAKAYDRHDAGSDTFNLYDTSALAETDLVTAMRQAHRSAVHATTQNMLLANVRGQITRAGHRAHRDPFRAGGHYDEFDVDSHTFGLLATVQMYDTVTPGNRFRSFAAAQRDWLFGANAWGASFMVGEGAHYPRCMQHQVANLAGGRDGKPPLLRGAVVNGPNSAGLFRGGLGTLQQGMRRCPTDRTDRYRQFNGHGSRYIDDVRSWQTSEPAIDMTATAVLASASHLAALRHHAKAQ